jgi:pyruvate formate lyase activating enzyme
MDIKAGADGYSVVTGVPIDMAKIRRSMELIRSSGIPYEWRTTIVPELPTDTTEIAKLLKKGETIYLQKFRPSEGTINPSLTKQTLPEEEEGILQPLLAAGLVASGVRIGSVAPDRPRGGQASSAA